MKKILLFGVVSLILASCCTTSAGERGWGFQNGDRCVSSEKVWAAGKIQLERVIAKHGERYIIKAGKKYRSRIDSESGREIFDILIEEAIEALPEEE